MNAFEIVMVVFAGLALIGIASAIIYHFSTRNNGNNNQNNNGANNQANLCAGGNLPVQATFTVPAQTVDMQAYLSLCNRRRVPIWAWIAIAVLGVTLLLALILYPKDNTASDKEQTITQVVPAPVPTPVPTPAPSVQFPNDYSKSVDMDTVKTLLRGVDTKLDKQIAGGKKGYSSINKKLDDIHASVKDNGKGIKNANDKLDALSTDLTLARTELKTETQELKDLLAGGATKEQLDEQIIAINKLKDTIVSIEIKIDNLKNASKGDSD